MNRIMLTIAALLAASGVAIAAEPPAGAGAPAPVGPLKIAPKCVAVKAGTAWLPDGPKRDVVVVIRGDSIASVGAGEPPAGCQVVAGQEVTAGLVDAASIVGGAEILLEEGTVDVDLAGREADGKGPGDIRAAFRVFDAYNPRSTLIPVTRLGGVTSVLVLPSGGVVSGQAAWADLAGRTQAEAVRRPVAALKASLGERTGSRAWSLQQIRRLLSEARSFAKARNEWEKNRSRPFASVMDLEAAIPVLTQKVPLLVGADRASDIEAALRVADEFGVRLVILGGAEAHLVADLLARAKVPVIVDPLVYGPGSFDQIHGAKANPAMLERAGVPLILASFEATNSRNLRHIAGNAVRGGLSKAAAIDAITRAPADAFGMTSHGRLAPGARANVAVWSGDPLELSTRLEAVFIGGRRVALESRQTRLLQKYRKLPAAHMAPLPLP